MTGQHDNGGERDRQLHQILLAYLKAVEKGQRPDRRELLDSHPEFASELAEFFASHDQVDAWAAPLLLVGQVVAVATPPPEETPSVGVEAEGSEAPLRAGTFGDYELLEELGQGGMGVVYKARQKSLHRLVALKMIRAGGRACHADVQRFRTEAEAAASLDHPHIVPIYEVGELEGQPYFTMKLVSGRKLAEQLPCLMQDPRATARLLVAVAQAVHHAHQRGILHRDLKPSNILLDAEGRPHVTDFGLAKRVEVDSSLTQSGLLVGTPSYMAPEQASGQRGAITTATDIYGLGALLYALLTGRPPFRGETILDTLEQVKQREPEPPSASNRQVDRDLETICLKCLQKESRDRYGSALALADDLKQWLAGEPIQARPISHRERVWRWCWRNPALAVLMTAVILLLLAGTTVSSYFALQANQRALDALQQKERADDNAAKAQANLDIAYRVLDDVYMDISEQSLPIFRALPKERRFLEKALTFYENIAKQQGTDRRVRQQTGLAYLRIGSIQAMLGQEAKAKENYRKALELFDGLVAEFPDDPESRHHLARCLIVPGTRASGPYEERKAKEQALLRAIDLLKGLANQFSANADYQHDLAEGYRNLSELLDQHKDEREKVLRLALGIRQKLAEEHPGEPNYWQGLGDSLSMLGFQSMNAGKLEEAEKHFRRSLDVRKKVADDFPSLRIHRYFLHHGYRGVAVVLQSMGRLQEAEENLRQALTISKNAVDDFPGAPGIRLAYFHRWYQLANLLEQMRRFEEGEQAYREAQAILKHVTRDHQAFVLNNHLIQDYPAFALKNLGPRDPSKLLPGGDPGLIELNSFLLAISPFHFEAYLQRGYAYERAWELQKAVGDYTMALALMPSGYKGHGDVLYARSCTYRRLQERSRADADMLTIAQLDLELRPEPVYSWPYPFNSLATRYLTGAEPQRDPNKALPLALKAAKLRPNYCVYLNTLGLTFYRMGEYSAAMENLQHSLRASKGETAAINYFVLAMCHARRDEATKAKDCYERAVHLLEEQQGKLHPRWKKELDAFRDEAKALLQARKIGGEMLKGWNGLAGPLA